MLSLPPLAEFSIGESRLTLYARADAPGEIAMRVSGKFVAIGPSTIEQGYTDVDLLPMVGQGLALALGEIFGRINPAPSLPPATTPLPPLHGDAPPFPPICPVCRAIVVAATPGHSYQCGGEYREYRGAGGESEWRGNCPTPTASSRLREQEAVAGNAAQWSARRKLDRAAQLEQARAAIGRPTDPPASHAPVQARDEDGDTQTIDLERMKRRFCYALKSLEPDDDCIGGLRKAQIEQCAQELAEAVLDYFTD